MAEPKGCLSLPGQHATLTRSSLAATGTGLLARCLQHETDHLDGIAYPDRLPDGERAAILAAVQADGRNGPTSGPGLTALSHAVAATPS